MLLGGKLKRLLIWRCFLLNLPPKITRMSGKGGSANAVLVKNDFLNNSECNFLIDYYTQYCESLRSYPLKQYIEERMRFKQSYLQFHSDLSYIVETSFSSNLPHKIRQILLRRKILRGVKKRFPFLNLDYDYFGSWSPGSFKEVNNYDSYYPGNHWISVCYLNDNFGGGETLVSDVVVRPEKGKLCVFNNKLYFNGVSKTFGPRYTYVARWQEN